MDFGTYYASKSFYDPIGKRQIVWGWIYEDRPNAEQQGCSRVQSLPREIQIDAELNRWIARPIRELQKLRDESTYRQYVNLQVNPSGSPVLLDGVLGIQYEIKAKFLA